MVDARGGDPDASARALPDCPTSTVGSRRIRERVGGEVTVRLGSDAVLLCQVGSAVSAFPVADVIETMRPLPVTPLPGLPEFVAGAAIIRGVSTPVVPLRRLFGDDDAPPGRFVSVRTGHRQVALAVDAIIGIGKIAGTGMTALPPLLQEAAAHGVARLGALDGALLAVLEGARLVPAGAVDAVAQHTATP